VRNNFFSQRVVNKWNALPQAAITDGISAETINQKPPRTFPDGAFDYTQRTIWVSLSPNFLKKEFVSILGQTTWVNMAPYFQKRKFTY
jgi:hypothetical protein